MLKLWYLFEPTDSPSCRECECYVTFRDVVRDVRGGGGVTEILWRMRGRDRREETVRGRADCSPPSLSPSSHVSVSISPLSIASVLSLSSGTVLLS